MSALMSAVARSAELHEHVSALKRRYFTPTINPRPADLSAQSYNWTKALIDECTLHYSQLSAALAGQEKVSKAFVLRFISDYAQLRHVFEMDPRSDSPDFMGDTDALLTTLAEGEFAYTTLFENGSSVDLASMPMSGISTLASWLKEHTPFTLEQEPGSTNYTLQTPLSDAEGFNLLSVDELTALPFIEELHPNQLVASPTAHGSVSIAIGGGHVLRGDLQIFDLAGHLWTQLAEEDWDLPEMIPYKTTLFINSVEGSEGSSQNVSYSGLRTKTLPDGRLGIFLTHDGFATTCAFLRHKRPAENHVTIELENIDNLYWYSLEVVPGRVIPRNAVVIGAHYMATSIQITVDAVLKEHQPLFLGDMTSISDQLFSAKPSQRLDTHKLTLLHGLTSIDGMSICIDRAYPQHTICTRIDAKDGTELLLEPMLGSAIGPVSTGVVVDKRGLSTDGIAYATRLLDDGKTEYFQETITGSYDPLSRRLDRFSGNSMSDEMVMWLLDRCDLKVFVTFSVSPVFEDGIATGYSIWVNTKEFGFGKNLKVASRLVAQMCLYVPNDTHVAVSDRIEITFFRNDIYALRATGRMVHLFLFGHIGPDLTVVNSAFDPQIISPYTVSTDVLRNLRRDGPQAIAPFYYSDFTARFVNHLRFVVRAGREFFRGSKVRSKFVSKMLSTLTANSGNSFYSVRGKSSNPRHYLTTYLPSSSLSTGSLLSASPEESRLRMFENLTSYGTQGLSLRVSYGGTRIGGRRQIETNLNFPTHPSFATEVSLMSWAPGADSFLDNRCRRCRKAYFISTCAMLCNIGHGQR